MLPFAILAATPPLVALAPPPTYAQPVLPAPVRAMIDAAIAGDDPNAVDTVVALARQLHPDADGEIDGLHSDYRTARARRDRAAAEARLAALAGSSAFDHWAGQLEFGASRSTGNSRTFGLYAAGIANREGIDWRHKLNLRADIQESQDVRTTQRVLASWQPNYKVTDRLYAYGLGQYEHDRFLGYDHRGTLGGGIGYGVIARSDMTLDFEGGPALRYTAPGDGENQTALAGRASLAFAWKIAPTLTFKQDSALFLEPGDRSLSATTALDTKLFGPLKARFSYNLQYERDAPPGVDPLDTLSRATIVYSF